MAIGKNKGKTLPTICDVEKSVTAHSFDPLTMEKVWNASHMIKNLYNPEKTL